MRSSVSVEPLKPEEGRRGLGGKEKGVGVGEGGGSRCFRQVTYKTANRKRQAANEKRDCYPRPYTSYMFGLSRLRPRHMSMSRSESF